MAIIDKIVLKDNNNVSTSYDIAVKGENVSGTVASATTATKLTSDAGLTSSNGSATQPVYFSGGKPVACTYTLSASVPANAKFTDTDTWRPLGTTADTACAGNDSRLSNARPASDVYSWAKASSKPSYTKAEVGLGNVDNTADSAKSVKYATSAGSAGALTSNAGSATKPVYFSGGKPVATTYSLNADVVGYESSLATGGWKALGGRTNGKKITVAYNNAAAAWNAAAYSSSLVFGAGDTKGLLDLGHKDPIVTFGGGSAGSSTDDNPVWYFKLSGTTGKTYTLPSGGGTLVNTSGSITGSSGSCTGNSATATALTSNGGSATQPIYFANGKPVACTYTLGKSVPSNAVFTDTHYTTGIRAGASGTNANSAATNGNVYIKVLDNTTYRGQVKIVGSGATTVTSNANGVITISSTDTNTTYSKLSQFTNDSGYITGINKSMVTTALGYTPPTADTNTWRGIADSLNSTDRNTSLSLYGGKLLNDKITAVNNKLNTPISSSEVATNDKYFDGETIYTKSFRFNWTFEKGGVAKFDHNISNVKYIWCDISNSFLWSGEYSVPIVFANYIGSGNNTTTTDRMTVQCNKTQVEISTPDSSWGNNWYKIITVKYVKN